MKLEIYYKFNCGNTLCNCTGRCTQTPTKEEKIKALRDALFDLELNLDELGTTDLPDYKWPDLAINKFTQHPTDQGCLWDKMSEEDRKKPMMLSCPCPKCTVRC